MLQLLAIKHGKLVIKKGKLENPQFSLTIYPFDLPSEPCLITEGYIMSIVLFRQACKLFSEFLHSKVESRYVCQVSGAGHENKRKKQKGNEKNAGIEVGFIGDIS